MRKLSLALALLIAPALQAQGTAGSGRAAGGGARRSHGADGPGRRRCLLPPVSHRGAQVERPAGDAPRRDRAPLGRPSPGRDALDGFRHGPRSASRQRRSRALRPEPRAPRHRRAAPRSAALRSPRRAGYPHSRPAGNRLGALRHAWRSVDGPRTDARRIRPAWRPSWSRLPVPRRAGSARRRARRRSRGPRQSGSRGLTASPTNSDRTTTRRRPSRCHSWTWS